MSPPVKRAELALALTARPAQHAVPAEFAGLRAGVFDRNENNFIA
jgi:hypothetical protein